MTNIREYIYNVNAQHFDSIALELFKKQYHENVIYREYVNALKVMPDSVHRVMDIPFLPISFFKSHTVLCGNEIPDLYFESSGTTGEITSKHYVLDAQLYEAALLNGFEEFYGSPEDYTILALLPSYLERKNASLIYMAKLLMKQSGHKANGFYLNEWDKLANTLRQLEAVSQKTLLLGVTFALLDFAAAYPMDLKHIILMETGGMKGRKEELTRGAVHDFLMQQWRLPNIHSEYGMTELLSQAYAKEKGLFFPSSTMKVFVRDINDPFEIKNTGTGCLNIIDLANANSCAFIATEDIASLHENGSFEILGRMDHSALRGCSLMTA